MSFVKNHDITQDELILLLRFDFYEWGGGHWCWTLDGGETCFPDERAVETALEYAEHSVGLGACAECEDYWPALEDDYLCSKHRRLLSSA